MKTSTGQLKQLTFLTDSNESMVESAQTNLLKHSGNIGISKSCSSADLLPFFLPGNKGIVLTGAKEAHELVKKRTILVEGSEVVLEQRAVSIRCRHGKDAGKDIFRHLGEREGRVLSGLKRLASNQPSRACWTGVYQNDASVALYFTLRDLGKACKGRYNNNQLLEALDTLHKSPTDLVFYDSDTNTAHPLKSPILPILRTVESDDLQLFESDRFKDSKYMCTFHPLISSDVANMNYRAINSARIDSRRSALARAIETRMSHSFIFASVNQCFNLTANRIMKENGLWTADVASKAQSVRYRNLVTAINELTLPVNMTEEEDEEKIYLFRKTDWTEKVSTVNDKIDDYRIDFWPTAHFVKQQISANSQVNKDRLIFDAASNDDFPISISDINDQLYLSEK